MDFLNDADDTATLWRYMDLSKFLDLILHKKLVFPRYDKFEDPFEGYAANFIELARKGLHTLDEFDEITIKKVMEILADTVSVYNYYAYVSCWHLNEFESAGMWKLYCNSPEALVVKTKASLLKKAIKPKSNQKIVYSKVTYDSKLDNFSLNDISDVDPHSPLLIKRESFDHEKEYRLLLTDATLKSEREELSTKIIDYEFMTIEEWCHENKITRNGNTEDIFKAYEKENNENKKNFISNILDNLNKNGY